VWFQGPSGYGNTAYPESDITRYTVIHRDYDLKRLFDITVPSTDATDVSLTPTVTREEFQVL
jgi:hypothetical protein